MKVLVTGGAGFIGSHLCENLVSQGMDVICFDNLSSGTLKNIGHIKDKITFIKGDANTPEIDSAFKEHKFDWVFHYAAVVGVKKTLEQPTEVLDDIFGIRRILELSRKTDVSRVIFSSSSEVYGEPVEIPEREDGHLNAKLPYSVTKLMGEKYMEAYSQLYGLNTTSLRFFNVYGPKQDSSDYGFVVGIFIKDVLNNKAPQIFGDGTQTRDFVYVDDNINASIEAAKSGKLSGEVLNIGTGKPTTLLDLAEEIVELCDKPDIKPFITNHGRNDVKHRFPDISKMRRFLNFKPKYPLTEGLKKTIAYYRS